MPSYKPLQERPNLDDDEDDEEDDHPLIFDLTVEDGPEWADTGLVYPDGRRIGRRIRERLGIHPWSDD